MREIRSLQSDVADSLVLSQERARALGARILRVASADTANIYVYHAVRQVTRIANNRILTGDDGDMLHITINTNFGIKESVTILGNQVDDTSIHDLVTQVEAAARKRAGSSWDPNPIPMHSYDYVPVNAWHEPTITALREGPSVLSSLIAPAQQAGLVAAGFVGLTARIMFVMNRDGLDGYFRETDSECTVTVRTKDQQASGWHGQAARDWSRIRPGEVANTALDIARRSIGVRSVEPGRRVAILSQLAVAQLLTQTSYAYDAYNTDNGTTPFSTEPGSARRNKLQQHVFDSRLTLSSDPADPEGGYCPFFWGGYPTRPMTWVEGGKLINLSYNPLYGAQKGKPYSEIPYSLRMTGGNTTIEQMIAQCQEGIYVNRFSDVQLLDPKTGMMTGVTRDGCFLIKDGKIDRPVKNFRFTDSPWFFLNRIEALGVPGRAAFGYLPPMGGATYEGSPDSWPRRPMIVPPMMVQDFNFTALADAV
jgi:predicted Zn-dependent protease